jgi:hypothetical protein
MTDLPRGIRNNNPANIKKNNIKWDGLSDVQDDNTFYKFDDMIYGIRAFFIIIFNDRKLYNIRSIKQIINRFAPESENPTNEYVNFIANKLDIDKDDELCVTDEEMLIKFAQSLFEFENGESCANMKDDIKDGLKLALRKLRKEK